MSRYVTFYNKCFNTDTSGNNFDGFKSFETYRANYYFNISSDDYDNNNYQGLWAYVSGDDGNITTQNVKASVDSQIYLLPYCYSVMPWTPDTVNQTPRIFPFNDSDSDTGSNTIRIRCNTNNEFKEYPISIKYYNGYCFKNNVYGTFQEGGSIEYKEAKIIFENPGDLSSTYNICFEFELGNIGNLLYYDTNSGGVYSYAIYDNQYPNNRGEGHTIEGYCITIVDVKFASLDSFPEYHGTSRLPSIPYKGSCNINSNITFKKPIDLSSIYNNTSNDKNNLIHYCYKNGVGYISNNLEFWENVLKNNEYEIDYECSASIDYIHYDESIHNISNTDNYNLSFDSYGDCIYIHDYVCEYDKSLYGFLIKYYYNNADDYDLMYIPYMYNTYKKYFDYSLNGVFFNFLDTDLHFKYKYIDIIPVHSNINDPNDADAGERDVDFSFVNSYISPYNYPILVSEIPTKNELYNGNKSRVMIWNTIPLSDKYGDYEYTDQKTDLKTTYIKCIKNDSFDYSVSLVDNNGMVVDNSEYNSIYFDLKSSESGIKTQYPVEFSIEINQNEVDSQYEFKGFVIAKPVKSNKYSNEFNDLLYGGGTAPSEDDSIPEVGKGYESNTSMFGSLPNEYQGIFSYAMPGSLFVPYEGENKMSFKLPALALFMNGYAEWSVWGTTDFNLASSSYICIFPVFTRKTVYLSDQAVLLKEQLFAEYRGDDIYFKGQPSLDLYCLNTTFGSTSIEMSPLIIDEVKDNQNNDPITIEAYENDYSSELNKDGCHPDLSHSTKYSQIETSRDGTYNENLFKSEVNIKDTTIFNVSGYDNYNYIESNSKKYTFIGFVVHDDELSIDDSGHLRSGNNNNDNNNILFFFKKGHAWSGVPAMADMYINCVYGEECNNDENITQIELPNDCSSESFYKCFQYHTIEEEFYEEGNETLPLRITPMYIAYRYVIKFNSSLDSYGNELNIEYAIDGNYENGNELEIFDGESIVFNTITPDLYETYTFDKFIIYDNNNSFEFNLNEEISWEKISETFESLENLYISPIYTRHSSKTLVLSSVVDSSGSSYSFDYVINDEYNKGENIAINYNNPLTLICDFTTQIEEDTEYTLAGIKITDSNGNVISNKQVTGNSITISYDDFDSDSYSYNTLYLHPIVNKNTIPGYWVKINNNTCRKVKLTSSYEDDDINSQTLSEDMFIEPWALSDGMFIRSDNPINISILNPPIDISILNPDDEYSVLTNKIEDTGSKNNPTYVDIYDFVKSNDIININYYADLYISIPKLKTDIYHFEFLNSLLRVNNSVEHKIYVHSFSVDNSPVSEYIKGFSDDDLRDFLLLGKMPFNYNYYVYSRNKTIRLIKYTTTHIIDESQHICPDDSDDSDKSFREISLAPDSNSYIYYMDKSDHFENLFEGNPYYNETDNPYYNEIGNYEGNGVFNFIISLNDIIDGEKTVYDYEEYACGPLIGYVTERDNDNKNTVILKEDDFFLGIMEPGVECVTIYGYDTVDSEKYLMTHSKTDSDETDSDEASKYDGPYIINYTGGDRDDGELDFIKNLNYLGDKQTMPNDFCQYQTGNQFVMFRLRNPYNGKVLNFNDSYAYKSTSNMDTANDAINPNTYDYTTHEQINFLTLWEQRSLFNALNGKPTYVNEVNVWEQISESAIESLVGTTDSTGTVIIGGSGDNYVDPKCYWYVNEVCHNTSSELKESTDYIVNMKIKRKAGRALVNNINDWFNWYKREESHDVITNGNTGAGGSPLVFVGPLFNEDYGCCINSDAVRSSITLGPGESLSIPIVVLYKTYEEIGRDTAAYSLGFDIRNNLYDSPLYYEVKFAAGYYSNITDTISSQKANVNSNVKYNVTVR